MVAMCQGHKNSLKAREKAAIGVMKKRRKMKAKTFICSHNSHGEK